MKSVSSYVGLAIIPFFFACATTQICRNTPVETAAKPVRTTDENLNLDLHRFKLVTPAPEPSHVPPPTSPASFSMKDQKSIPALVAFSDTHPDTHMLKAVRGQVNNKTVYFALVSWDEHPELPFQSVCQDRPNSEHTVVLSWDDHGKPIETFGNKGVFELPAEKGQVFIGDLFFQKNRLLVVKENDTTNAYALQGYTLDGKGLDSSFGSGGTIKFPQFPPTKDPTSQEGKGEEMCGEQLPKIKIFMNHVDQSFAALGARPIYNLLSRYNADGSPMKGFGKQQLLGKEKYSVPPGTLVLPILPKEHDLKYTFFSKTGDISLLGYSQQDQSVLLLYDNQGNSLTKKSYILVDKDIYDAVWHYKTLRRGIVPLEDIQIE